MFSALIRNLFRQQSFQVACLGLFGALLAGPAIALELRVSLLQEQDELVVGSSTPAKVVNGQGSTLGTLPALEGFFAKSTPGAVTFFGQRAWQLSIEPAEDGFVYIKDRWYRGQVRLVTTAGGIAVINEIDLEDYIAGVIGKEMPRTWPQEALKAQAVAARSFALYRRSKQKNPLYDLVNTTKDQVYGGIDGEAESTRTAVRATAGQVLTYQGSVVEALFHANSGGHTENSEQVFSGTIPYLRGVPDFDQEAPNFTWSVDFSQSQLQQRLPGLGNILAMTPLGTTAHGRVKAIKIVGDLGAKTMKGREFRRALKLKSTLFTIAPQGNLVASQSQSVAGKPSGFTIQGRGHGHGLGMSQWGALALAQKGTTYQQILHHYYRNTVLQTIQ
ncbi:SpoIID/LytB domain-containing protein [Acaryochloris sp. IP29b_bin.137]|uniref:SpoIID/LytB domain-containing protein n=1 Tax=Acaryochloris sp. IP29b_bin.137 TaxID=2969217 RepID=UPI0026327C57|nr:SpoIID/LytB domain-containing protein [Acaryochloris sp. IP29b_bin.137]